MSTKTSNAGFRKLDVENFEEDNYRDDDDKESLTGPDEAEVNSLVAQNKLMDAVKALLRNPPLGAKGQVKDRAVSLAVKVLTSIKAAEIERTVQALNSSELQTLLKYVYKGFELPQDNSSAMLLNWHDKIYSVGGAGCLVRVLTDRKPL